MFGLFLILVILTVVILWAAKFCYRIVFYNRNSKEQDVYVVPPGEQYEKIADAMLARIHELNQLPFEQIYITARDGVKLAARYYHFKDNSPVQIQFHGYRGNGIREFSGGYAIAKAAGFNVIVVDERAHGRSGGHTITFGIKERYDCVDWANYACKRFGEDTPIILSGVSMGAATVLMASELGLPHNVAAITADCPYSSPGAIIRKVCRGMRLPAYLVYPFVILGARIFGGFNLREASALKAVQNTNIPILLIHGDDDRFVPYQMSHQIYNACTGPCELVTIPGAGHGISCYVDQSRYTHALKKFFKSHGLIA